MVQVLFWLNWYESGATLPVLVPRLLWKKSICVARSRVSLHRDASLKKMIEKTGVGFIGMPRLLLYGMELNICKRPSTVTATAHFQENCLVAN